METDVHEATARVEFVDASSCEARQVLDMVADKWSLYVVAVLGALHRYQALDRRYQSADAHGHPPAPGAGRHPDPDRLSRDATERDLRAHLDGPYARRGHRAAHRLEHESPRGDRRGAAAIRSSFDAWLDPRGFGQSACDRPLGSALGEAGVVQKVRICRESCDGVPGWADRMTRRWSGSWGLAHVSQSSVSSPTSGWW
jgi:hypothetical protein